MDLWIDRQSDRFAGGLRTSRTPVEGFTALATCDFQSFEAFEPLPRHDATAIPSPANDARLTPGLSPTGVSQLAPAIE